MKYEMIIFDIDGTLWEASEITMIAANICSLEGLMLKLKLQYFGHLMRRIDSLEQTLMLGKTEGWRKRGQQMMSWSADV